MLLAKQPLAHHRHRLLGIERIPAHEQVFDQYSVESGEQEAGRCLGFEPMSTLSFSLGLRDQLDQHRAKPRVELQNLLAETLGKMLIMQHLREEKPDGTCIVAHKPQVRLNQLFYLSPLVQCTGFLCEVDEIRFKQTVQNGYKQFFLGLEVPKNQRLADMSFAGDLGHRGLVKATAG